MIDIILIAVLAIAVITGLRRGLIGQVGAIAAVVLSLIACRTFGDTLTGALGFLVPASLKDTPMERFIPSVVSNTIVYVAVYYMVRLVAGVIRATAKMLLMGPLDKVLGVIFSLFKWGLGLSIALNLWLAICPTSDFVKRSTLGGGVAAESVMELAPWFWGVCTDIYSAGDESHNNTEAPDVVNSDN